MTSAHEAELAASLQTAWDRETAAVYADLLVARGDPRGELIALDLALEHDPNPALIDRKRELIHAWIGDPIPRRTWELREVQYGLLCGFGVGTSNEVSMVEQLERVHAAVGTHLRDLALYGTHDDLKATFDAMVALGSWPWLRHLTIHRTTGTRAIDQQTWHPVVAATPNLVSMTIEGKSVITSPIHPRVRSLAITGLAIVVGRKPIDGVTELDFRFADRVSYRTERPSLDKLVGVVNPRAFPALRTLDISRNVPPSYDVPPRPIALDFLDALEQPGRFERVRIAQLGNDSTAALVDLLDRHPTLVIEIARIYTTLDVSHPRLIVPVPRVWPAQPHGRDALTVRVTGAKYDEELALSSIVEDLEQQFDAMSADAQAAWIAFWAFLDDLPWEDEHGNTIYKEMPAARLLTALEALVGNGRCDNVARNIRDAKLPADATVTVSRYWGW